MINLYTAQKIIKSKNVLAIFLVFESLCFAGGCTVSNELSLKLNVTNVIIDGKRIDLNTPGQIQTNISVRPFILIAFSKELALTSVQEKIKLFKGEDNLPLKINLVLISDTTFRITPESDNALATNTTYTLTIESGLKTEIDGESYVLNPSFSFKFSTIKLSNDLDLEVTYKENNLLSNNNVFVINAFNSEDLANIQLEFAVNPVASLYFNQEETPLELENGIIAKKVDFQIEPQHTLRVAAENGDKKTYTLIIKLLQIDSKEINAFAFEHGQENFMLTDDISGEISGTQINVKLPKGISRTVLKPSIHFSGKNIQPKSEVSQDFTQPITYTVTALDGSKQIYTVIVTNLESEIIHTVKFDSNEGQRINSQRVVEGEKVQLPNDPVRADYIFDGWYKEETFQNKFIFDSELIEDDITLYAKWIGAVAGIASLSIDGNSITFSGTSATVSQGYAGSILTTINYANFTLFNRSTAIDENVQPSSSLLESGQLKLVNNVARIRVTSEDKKIEKTYLIFFNVLDKPITSFYTHCDTLGPAIKDPGLGDFIVATISHVTNQSYTLSLGNRNFQKKAENGEFSITRNDLKDIDVNDNDPLTINYSGGTEKTLAIYKSNHINAWQDLQAIRLDLNGNYILMRDIEFPMLGENGLPVEGFQPLGFDKVNSLNASGGVHEGYQGNPFTGSIDGNHKTIINFKISNTSLAFAGLFGKVETEHHNTEVLKNVIFKNPYILCQAIAGTGAAWLKKGKIVDVGIVVDDNSKSKIETIASQKINADDAEELSWSYTAGLVGRLDQEGQVNRCYSQVSVKGLNYAIGGLVGYNNTSQEQIVGYATGSIVGTKYVGGLVGYTFGGKVVGFATGSVMGDTDVGGLVGRSFRGEVSGYATNRVIGNSSGNNIGGLVGFCDRGVIVGYATGDVSGKDNVGGLAGSSAGKVTGFATGTVLGNNWVGGLAGIATEALGYTRSKVMRLSESTAKNFGTLVGGGSAVGYMSSLESSVVDQATNIIFSGRLGRDGTNIQVTQNTTQSDFSQLTLINNSLWQWENDGKWPAVKLNFPVWLANIATGDNSAEQPINP